MSQTAGAPLAIKNFIHNQEEQYRDHRYTIYTGTQLNLSTLSIQKTLQLQQRDSLHSKKKNYMFSLIIKER